MSFRGERSFDDKFREEKVLSLTTRKALKENKELKRHFAKLWKEGIHGLCFSPYEEGQSPGDLISEEQIRRRMALIAPHTKWIRSFSCTEGNENIARIAREFGLKTLVGAWLGTDAEINRKEVDGLVTLCKEGVVDIAAVGNEVLYRGDLTEEELLGFIAEVKDKVEVPVGYVDAYYEFTAKPKVTEICDVILANCYPYWEACPFEYSLLYMKEMYAQAKVAAKGKPVLISETGWPSDGAGLHAAVPSKSSAMGYFINTQQWTKEDDIPVFYFSSFDKSWKVGAEGDVGAYWGIYDKEEQLKL